MSLIVAVYGSSRIGQGSAEYRAAERCGRLLAAAGVAVATGGYDGAMEAVSRGAHESGGHVVGITAPDVFPDRSGANAYVAEERPAATITQRLDRLIGGVDGAIALPGSIGTFTELVVAWNANYLAPRSRRDPRPLAAVGAEWAELLALLGERLGVPGGLAATVATVDEAVDHVVAALRV